MNQPTLRELVDWLPTQSLELFVQAYEAGEVGEFTDYGGTRLMWPEVRCRCPRAALGFDVPGMLKYDFQKHASVFHKGHPADVVEDMALRRTLDTAALYDECVLAITERDGSPQTTEPREPVEAGR